jgi:hypothetical protein
VRFIAMLLILLSVTAKAAPFAAQVGDVRVALDAPPGFADTAFTGSPRLQELAETLTPASNRILLFAISDDDLRRFMSGDTPAFRRYMVVATPRAAELERVTPAAFSALVAETQRGLGQPAASGDLAKQLNARGPGEMSLVAQLRNDADAFAVLQGTRLPQPPRSSIFEAEKPQQYLLSSTSLVLLRGRTLHLTVFTSYDGPADLDWIRLTTGRWIDELRRLNSR